MEEVEAHAERVLASVPPWLWDGESLPVPIEDMADSCFGLLVREVGDLTAAPGVPRLTDHNLCLDGEDTGRTVALLAGGAASGL